MGESAQMTAQTRIAIARSPGGRTSGQNFVSIRTGPADGARWRAVGQASKPLSAFATRGTTVADRSGSRWLKSVGEAKVSGGGQTRRHAKCVRMPDGISFVVFEPRVGIPYRGRR